MPRLVLCLIVSLLLCGCGPAEEKLVPVSGIITVQGMPLPYGTITLIPDAAQGNTSQHQPYGTVGSDGKFALQTDGKPGAPLGRYIVTISSVKPPTPEEGMKPAVFAASQDYLDPTKSGLTLDVVETPAAGVYDLKLDKK
jgi:hypothetical protein